MSKFFNNRIYTDVESAIVLSENGDTCQVCHCRKVSKIDMDFTPGGFVGHVNNNEEMFSEGNYEIETIGEPFTLIKKGDVWGRMYHPVEKEAICGSVELAEEFIRENPDPKKEYYYTEVSKGWVEVWAYKLTKTGKRFNRFSKFWSGKMEDTCRYYYDYNF